MQLNTPRPQEFGNAIAMYKGYGVNITNLTLEQKDEGQELSSEELTIWKTLLNNLHQTPDIVLTHNIEGEYGHPHHKSLNRIAHELFSNVWEFICPGAVNVAPQPFKSKVNVVPLSQEILNKKTEVFNRSYTTQLACWKVLPEIMQYEFRTGPEIYTSE
jgi:LmbE family N-acetylglucosaminyl deacetylase